MLDSAVAPPPLAAAPVASRPSGAVHRLVEGTELIGEYQDSGLQDPRYLIRRSDGQIMQLPRLLYRVAASLDGRRNDDQLAEDLSRELGEELTGDQVTFLVEERLHPAGIIAVDQSGDGNGSASPPAPVRSDPLLALRYRVGVVPAASVWRIAGFLRPFFWRPVWVTALATFVALDVAIVAQGDLVDRTLAGVTQVVRQPSLTLAILGVTLLSAAFHECGHVTACRYGGARPGDMGIGLYIVWPALYSTVTDAYRLDRVGRLRTDLGGVYFNAMSMAVVSVVFLKTGQPWLLLLLLTLHTETAWQFLPSIRLDGYYMLADLVGVPELFSYLKPVLLSVLPWRPTDPRVRALKPWSRRVIVAWVLAVVPTLSFYLVAFLIVVPQALPVLWDTLLEFWQGLDESVRAGAISTTALGVLQLLLLLLPWIGSALIAWTVIGMLHRGAVRRWGRGRVPPATGAAVRWYLKVAVVAALGGAVVARAVALGASLPATTDEIGLTDGALAVLRGGTGEPSPGIEQLVLQQQLVGYAAVSGAFGRHAGAVAGAREMAVLATAVLIACLVAMVVLRRLSPLAVGLPLLATLAMGPAMTSLTTLGPGVVGGAWVAVGVLITVHARSRFGGLTGGVAVTLGVVTEPLLTVPLGVCLLAMVVRSEFGGTVPTWWSPRSPDGRVSRHSDPSGVHRARHLARGPRGALLRRSSAQLWVVVVSVFVLVVGALAVASAVGRGALPLGGSERAVLLFVIALAAGTGLLVPRLRSVSLGAASVVVLAALPWSGADSALVLALPAAVLVAALVIEQVVRTAVDQRTHPLLRSLVAAPLLLATVVGTLFVPVEGAPLPHAELAAWLNAPSAPDGKVAVPAGLWGDLVREGVSPGRLTRAPAEPDGGSEWVVAVGPPEAGAQPLASFGTGATALSVLMPAGTTPPENVADPDRTARQTLGSVLAASTRLTAPPEVLDALRVGGVDPRVLVLLAGLTADHTVAIGAMPTVGAEDALGILRHQVVVTGLDGVPTNRAAGAEVLTDWLDRQPPELLPSSVTRSGAGVTVVWPLPAPPTVRNP